jgi:hypothetical protein
MHHIISKYEAIQETSVMHREENKVTAIVSAT